MKGFMAAAAALVVLTIVPFAVLFFVGGRSGGPDGGKGSGSPELPQILSMGQADLAGQGLSSGASTRLGVILNAELSSPTASFEAEVRNATQELWRVSGLSGPDRKVRIFVYLPPGSYTWRGRAKSASGSESEWREAGTPGAAGFVIEQVVVKAGGAEGSFRLDQATLDRRPLKAGEVTESGVILHAEGVDRAFARLEVEVVSSNAGFTGKGSFSKAIDPDGRAALEIPLAAGPYQWRGRLQRPDGSPTEWRVFDTQGHEAAFLIRKSDVSQPLPSGEKNLDDADRRPLRPVSGSLFDGTARVVEVPVVVTQPPLWSLLEGRATLTGAAVVLGILSLLWFVSRFHRKREA